MKQYTRKSDNYAGKIEYYQAKLAMAVDALEIHNIKFYTTKLHNIKFYTTKLEYFITRSRPAL